MNEQQELGIKVGRSPRDRRESVEDYRFDPIRGQPMLRWAGKRPFTSAQYFPAQEKERHGEETDGWMNELYWGDNLQVMSHLLKKYRGRVNLIYIDPPFDSKADYKKRITLRGKAVLGDRMGFEEKRHLYFTGMLTSDKTDFRITYIDPESNTLRSYYPDFLAQKRDGSYVIVEVKGEHMIEDAVVQAKAKSATEIASANAMSYLMVPSKNAAYGLHQPVFGLPLVGGRGATALSGGRDGARPSRDILAAVAEALRFREYLPIYSLRAACGKFGDGEDVECEGWVKVEECGRLDKDMFVVQACGRSMEPKIHDGDLCVMRARPQGSRVGMIVLAQHHETSDPDTGGAYSIKKYTSEKSFDEDGSWHHEKITLLPLNPDYGPIELGEGDSIVAELVKVL